MMEIVAAVMIITGSAFALLAALGILRMPDLFTRMQATTKANTLGVGLILGGVMLSLQTLEASSKALLVLVFVFLTTPVGAQMLSRAAHLRRNPIWSGTIVDEMVPLDIEVEKQEEEAKDATRREKAN